MSSAPEQSAPGADGAAEAGRQYVPRPSPGYDDSAGYTEERPRGAAFGLTMMAAVLMMLSGVWNFLEGLAAIIKGTFFVLLPNYAFNASAVAWGWTHLILGAVVFLAGICLFMDLLWARITGIVLASISAIVNFLYIPYTPVWSVIVIAIDLFIIWALLVPRSRYA
jgi:hypothetical protein